MIELEEFKEKNLIQEDETFCFETTPLNKVFILSMVTLGAYGIVLIYNYWKAIKNHFNLKISPFWRCIFYQFTNFKLFPILKKYFGKYKVGFSAMLWASLSFIINFIASYMDKAKNKIYYDNSTILVAYFMFIVFSTFSVFILVFIQSKINKINKTNFPNAKINSWNIFNIVWIIVYIIWFCFISKSISQ